VTPERRSELLVSACFATTTFAAAGLAVVYWRGGQPQIEGCLLGLAFAGLGVGTVLSAHRFLPGGGAVEARHPLASPRSVDDDLHGDLARGGLSRRRLITVTFTAGVGALLVAAAFPLRSLGPSPGSALTRTSWAKGRRAVTADERVVLASDVVVGSLVTAFPEGFAGSADSQVVLLRVDPESIEPRAGRESWAPDGLLAFSKVCTHAGCPVGLYEAERHELLCPCHQSAFDVLDHARPVLGPAAVELPQLPLAVDGAGAVVAQGDFSAPVGPAFWHRT
jgi:ubiquinol-cytochrome c reductase iron-sulfur subunit